MGIQESWSKRLETEFGELGAAMPVDPSVAPTAVTLLICKSLFSSSIAL